MNSHLVIFRSNMDCVQRLLHNFNDKNRDALFNLNPMLNDRVVIYKHVRIVVSMVVSSRTWEIDEFTTSILSVELCMPSHFQTIKDFEKFLQSHYIPIY